MRRSLSGIGFGRRAIFGFARKTESTVLVVILAIAAPAAWACPKILMFDGVDIKTQTKVVSAEYWANIVGVQGVFLNHVMSTWQKNVGASSDGQIWVLAKRFQTIYSRFGVTDNFLKVRVPNKPYDWRNVKENEAVLRNFRDAARLAKYAGLKGVALDLEPYVPVWGGSAGGPGADQAVYREGLAIGKAMHEVNSGMTLVLIKDVLHWASLHKRWHGGFGLAPEFVKGLLKAGFDHVVIATEQTYKDSDVAGVVKHTLTEYRNFAAKNHLPVKELSVAPGLWPLGKSYQDKTARLTPAQFRQELQAAFTVAPDYVWIYGYGSAWQTDGPYGKGPVVKNFNMYTGAIHRVEAACAAGHLSRSAR